MRIWKCHVCMWVMGHLVRPECSAPINYFQVYSFVFHLGVFIPVRFSSFDYIDLSMFLLFSFFFYCCFSWHFFVLFVVVFYVTWIVYSSCLLSYLFICHIIYSIYIYIYTFFFYFSFSCLLIDLLAVVALIND